MLLQVRQRYRFAPSFSPSLVYFVMSSKICLPKSVTQFVNGLPVASRRVSLAHKSQSETFAALATFSNTSFDFFVARGRPDISLVDDHLCNSHPSRNIDLVMIPSDVGLCLVFLFRYDNREFCILSQFISISKS